MVCCIDTRSEGLRRHLEGTGAYEILGFAGFIAVAIRYTDLANGASDDLCPVLIQPSFAVSETPAPGADLAVHRHLAGLQRMTGADSAFHNAKHDTVSPLALAEASGWFAGAASAARTLSPRASATIARMVRRHIVPPTNSQVTIETGFSTTEAGNLLFGLRELFEDTAGVMFLTDTYVSRPDYFAGPRRAHLVLIRCALGSVADLQPGHANPLGSQRLLVRYFSA